MGTIIEVVSDIQSTVTALTGIRSVPQFPVDSLPGGLAAIVYPASGSINANSAGWMQELHTVHIDLILPAKDLARDLATLSSYLRSIPNGLMADPTFGGKASTFDAVSYQYVTFEEGGIQYRGYRFIVSGIKIQPTIT